MTMPYTSSHPESHSFERSMPLTGAGDERAVLDLTRTSAEIHGLIVAFLYAHKADPQEPQLTQATCDLVSIKVVNQHSEHLWKSFETLAQQFGFDMPALIEIGNMYKDAKGLRETGVFAFRDIRSGTGLAHLGPIFAVVSLSYIISLLLVMQCIEQTDILLDVLLDVQVWSDAIQDDGERAVFVFLVQQLWPQTLGGIEYRPAPQGPSLPGIGYAGQCRSLYGTRAFKVIDGFLHQFGSLLHLLSGGSSVNPSQFLGFRESESHILTMIQVRYVDPRGSSRIFMSSQAYALLAVARKLVGLGYLQSFEEVQRYMITVGKELLPDGPSYPSFCQWVLSRPEQATPSTAAGSPGSDPGTPGTSDGMTATVPDAPAPFECNSCGKTFPESWNLGRHEKRHDPTFNLYCPAASCGHIEVGGRWDKLRGHWVKEHPEQELPPELRPRRRQGALTA